MSATDSGDESGENGMATPWLVLIIVALVIVVVASVIGGVLYMRAIPSESSTAEPCTGSGGERDTIQTTLEFGLRRAPLEQSSTVEVISRPQPADGWQGFRSRMDTEVNPYQSGRVAMVPETAVAKGRPETLYAIPMEDVNAPVYSIAVSAESGDGDEYLELEGADAVSSSAAEGPVSV